MFLFLNLTKMRLSLHDAILNQFIKSFGPIVSELPIIAPHLIFHRHQVGANSFILFYNFHIKPKQIPLFKMILLLKNIPGPFNHD